MTRAQEVRPAGVRGGAPGLVALLGLAVASTLLLGLVRPDTAAATTTTAVGAADTAWAQTLAAAGATGTLAVVVSPVPATDSGLRDRTPLPVGNAAADRGFYTASLVKLFVVEDVLHRARTGALQLTTADRQQLMAMLISSDDPAMNAAWDRWGGDQMVRDVATRYGLTGTTPPAQLGQWGESVTTANDVARFLAALPVTADPADATTIRFWLALATPRGADGFDQTFGLLATDAPGTAAKQGWMCCVDGTRQVHSAGYVGDDVVVLLGEVPSAAGWGVATAGLDAAATAIGH